MARVTINAEECDGEFLPPICVKCGEASTTLSKQSYKWFPFWIIPTFIFGVLPYIILAGILTRKMTVFLPTCGRHYYLRRNQIIVTVIGVTTIISVITTAASLSAARYIDTSQMITMTVAGIIAGIIIISFANLMSIFPMRITKSEITLVNISSKFADHLEYYRILSEE